MGLKLLIIMLKWDINNYNLGIKLGTFIYNGALDNRLSCLREESPMSLSASAVINGNNKGSWAMQDIVVQSLTETLNP